MDIYARIRQVAFEMVAEGEWPTVVAVRERLGTGSNTTINNTLKQWRQDFLSRHASSAQHPDWPPALAEAFAQLWRQACLLAEDGLASLREEVQQQLQLLGAELARAQGELVQAQAQLTHTAAELAQERARAGQLQAQLEAALQRVQGLELNGAALAASLDEARLQTLAVQKDADERVVALEARQALQLQQLSQEAAQREALAYERFEGMRVRLYEQVESERGQMKQQLQQLTQQWTAAQQQADASRVQLQQLQADYAREQGKLSAQQQAAALRIAELEQRCAKGDEMDAARQQQLLTLAAEAAAARTENQMLREQRLPQLLQLVLSGREQLAALPLQQASSLLHGWAGVSAE